jgi:hypothetical protein
MRRPEHSMQLRNEKVTQNFGKKTSIEGAILGMEA